MRALISALMVAGAVAFSLPAFADDVKTNPNPTAKPGRAIDDGAVKSGPVEKPGRAADDTVKTDPTKLNKPGRAADDTVRTSKDPIAKPGRAADDSKPAKKSKKKKAQAPTN